MTPSSERATFTVGHWTDREHQTGCTTILFDRLVPAIVDIRGGSPGTRETELLGPERSVGSVDAIFLTGGSAHGLGAADGVMRYLREQGRGWPTRAGNVPIVTAAVIYDLAVGDPVWPSVDNGYSSCLDVRPIDRLELGPVGVGTGATFRKAWPDLAPLAGGVGTASAEIDGLGTIYALAVVNAVGDVAIGGIPEASRSTLLQRPVEIDERSATTLVVVIVDGEADSRTLRRAGVAAHDGMARTIWPSHTQWDGDLVYVVSTGESSATESADSFRWCVGAELVVEAAILSAAGR